MIDALTDIEQALNELTFNQLYAARGLWRMNSKWHGLDSK